MRHRREAQRLNAKAPARPRRKVLTELQERMKQRKAALAFSAGVMGLSTAAMGSQAETPMDQLAISQMANPLVRLPASHLHVSDSFKEALVQEEGVREVVYRDVAGYPTVGCGHLVTPADGLKVGDKVSYDQILDFLEEDLKEAEAAVTRLVGNLPLFQHEFDALVDLVYNVGEGNVSPSESPRLNAAIAARDYDGIAEELEYRFAAGEMARGLVYRSERRARIFTHAAYEDTRSGTAAGPLNPA
jgi:GH24 family phage-related lysozyme (muramidase)